MVCQRVQGFKVGLFGNSVVDDDVFVLPCFPVSNEFGSGMFRFACQKDQSGCSVEDGMKKGKLKSERSIWKLLQETLQRMIKTCTGVQQEGWKEFLSIQNMHFLNSTNQ